MTTQQAWDTDVTTPLDAATLNTLAVANSWLKSPATLTSGNVTISGSSLVVGMPALTLAVNPASTGGTGAPAYLSVTASNVTLVSPAGNTTYYIYLSSGGSYTYGTTATSTGLATIVSVVTNSGGTGIASVAQVITPYALLASDVGAASGVSISGFVYTALKTVADQLSAISSAIASIVQTAVGYDSTEASSAAGSSSITDNLNHVREAILNTTGQAFSTMVAGTGKEAILSDGSNAGAAVRLPGTLSIGGKAPILEDGTNADASVTLSALILSGGLTVDGKLKIAGTAPVLVTVGAAAGSGGVATFDHGGPNMFMFHVTVGSSPTTGTIASVILGSSYVTAGVTLIMVNQTSSGLPTAGWLNVHPGSVGSTGFNIDVDVAPVNTYTYYFTVFLGN